MTKAGLAHDRRCSLCSSSDLRTLFQKAGYDCYECVECGHVRVFPYPSDEQTRAHYQQAFTDTYLGDNQAWFEVLAKTRLDILARHFGPDFRGSVLDVGSGFGFFLKRAADAGWSALGIETSESEHAYSTRELGLTIVNRDVLDAFRSLPAGSFDAVTFWHVLEHLEEPGLTLRESMRLLRPPGVLVLNSPNLDSAVFRLLKQRWSWIYVPGHLQYFRVNRLAEWVRGEGLNIRSVETWAHAPNLYFMLEEAGLLGFADLLGSGWLGRKFGARVRRFVYSAYHQQVVQQRLRDVYRLTPCLDRYLLSRHLGHEFLILASK